jgi:hypothetical protein
VRISIVGEKLRVEVNGERHDATSGIDVVVHLDEGGVRSPVLTNPQPGDPARPNLERQ